MNLKNHTGCEVPLPDNTRLFSKIAATYDFVNHLLSLNIDKRWRRKLVRCAGAKRGEKILDVCTGTGDVAIRFAQNNQAAEIVGIDLSEEMLRIAARKMRRNLDGGKVRLLKGNALCLPFDDDYFDIVTVAFGLRNIEHHRKGICEMVRVLRHGGQLLILEFSPPGNDLFGICYRLCLNTIIPAVGGVISGSTRAYRYLSSSIAGFPKPDQIIRLMKTEGLKKLYSKRLTGGIAYIHRGEK